MDTKDMDVFYVVYKTFERDVYVSGHGWEDRAWEAKMIFWHTSKNYWEVKFPGLIVNVGEE